MKLGHILGRDAVDLIERRVEKAERRDKDVRRQREIAKAKRDGRTIRYKRDDDR